MPIPRVAIPKHKVSENDRKLYVLENTLYDMGYNCEEPKDMVKVIEMFGLDKSQFDFPFGSYDAFKAHIENGEYDNYGVVKLMTAEELDALDKAIKEGRACMSC